MEQAQELSPLNKTDMAHKVEEISHNEAETWYKIVSKADAEVLGEPSSHSEDERNLSHDDSTLESARAKPSRKGALPRSKPKPLTKSTDTSTLQALEEDYHNLQETYDTTLLSLESTNRENRDQSLELRDLKRQLAKLTEQNGKLREQNGLLREAYEAQQARGEKVSKSERRKYSEHFEMLENHIEHLQRERHKRETHMEFLTGQTREANDSKEQLEAEIRKLQRQTRDLSANLTECKDDLLRLQPTSQVSDNEISEQFSDIDQQIAGWVDDQTEDPLILEERIKNMKTVDDLPELLRMFATSDHLRLAKKYPDSQPLLLRYFIHCYLQTFILSSEVYLFGLDERNIALLQGIEEGMTQLEPRRDDKTLRNWRSETFRGLLNIPTFRTEQTRLATIASSTLSAALASLTSPFPSPEDTTPDPSPTLHNQIILPAIALSLKLRLATSDYHLVFNPSTTRGHADPAKAARTAYHYEIPHSCMMDLATHKVIRPDSVVKVGPDGRIGDEVLVVAPALVRASRTERGVGKVVVCKATVLVRLDEPMGKRARGIKALGAWTPSWFGGDEGVE